MFPTVKDFLLSHVFLGIGLVRWLIFFGALLVALLGSKIVERLISRWIQGLAFIPAKRYDLRLIGSITPIIRWAILLYTAHLGFNYLHLDPELHSSIVDLFKIGYTILAGFLLSNILRLLLEIWADQTTEDREDQLRGSLIPAITKVANVLIFLLCVLLILQNAGYNILSLLTGMGIGGIAVALAAQETLANLFGSITIFVDRSFRVGDRILISTFDGTVERIGLRCTSLRLLDGTLASLPNKIISQAPINNISSRRAIRHTLTVSLSPLTTFQKVQEALLILNTVYNNHPLTQEVTISWKDYLSTSLDIPIVYWCKTTNYSVFLKAVEEINFEIKRQFELAGIEFATPFPSHLVIAASNLATKT